MRKFKYIAFAILCIVAVLATGCTATTKTITQTVAQGTVTQWTSAVTNTITLPGSTITQPAVTLTLPAVTNTIVQPVVTTTITETEPPVTLTFTSPPVTTTVYTTAPVTITPPVAGNVALTIPIVYCSSGMAGVSGNTAAITAQQTAIVYDFKYVNNTAYNFNAVTFRISLATNLPASAVVGLTTNNGLITWYPQVVGANYTFIGLPTFNIPANGTGEFILTLSVALDAVPPAGGYYIMANPIASN